MNKRHINRCRKRSPVYAIYVNAHTCGDIIRTHNAIAQMNKTKDSLQFAMLSKHY